jgi:hypothetical protein
VRKNVGQLERAFAELNVASALGSAERVGNFNWKYVWRD